MTYICEITSLSINVWQSDYNTTYTDWPQNMAANDSVEFSDIIKPHV